MIDQKMLDDARRSMVELLRAAADLIEDGTLTGRSVDQELGTDTRIDTHIVRLYTVRLYTVRLYSAHRTLRFVYGHNEE